MLPSLHIECKDSRIVAVPLIFQYYFSYFYFQSPTVCRVRRQVMVVDTYSTLPLSFSGQP